MNSILFQDFFVLIVALMLLNGCSGFKNGTRPDINKKKVFLTTEGYTFENRTKFFSDQTQNKVEDTFVVDSVAKLILNKLNIAYPDLTKYDLVEDSTSADLVVTVSKIRLKRRIYNINFLHIGPLYALKMEIDIQEKNGERFMYTARSVANMSWENFGNETAHIMSNSEKKNTKYQYHNYIIALKRAYYNFYINLFRYK